MLIGFVSEQSIEAILQEIAVQNKDLFIFYLKSLVCLDAIPFCNLLPLIPDFHLARLFVYLYEVYNWANIKVDLATFGSVQPTGEIADGSLFAYEISPFLGEIEERHIEFAQHAISYKISNSFTNGILPRLDKSLFKDYKLLAYDTIMQTLDAFADTEKIENALGINAGITQQLILMHQEIIQTEMIRYKTNPEDGKSALIIRDQSARIESLLKLKNTLIGIKGYQEIKAGIGRLTQDGYSIVPSRTQIER